MGFLQGGYEVVERTKLTAILDEQDLSATNIVDGKSATHAGRVIGVDTLALGSVRMIDLVDIGGQYKVIHTTTVRLIDVATGRTMLIATYTRNTDLATEDVTVIAERLCESIHRRMAEGGRVGIVRVGAP
jgi:hypothetical protein